MTRDWGLFQIHEGDALESLRAMAPGSAQCCVTSPPYYGLRSYLPNGVVIRPDRPLEKRAAILAELEARGVFPLRQSSV